MPLYAGVSETDITPPPGVWMGGYGGRSTGAIGVHDPLYAQAIVLDNGRNRLVLIVADLVALDDDIVANVRTGAARLLDVAPGAVMVHCTHTHGGPLVKSYRAMGVRDEPYVDILIRKLIGVASMAVEVMQPVVLTYGEAPAQIGVNRRSGLPGKEAVMGTSLRGPVFPRVQTLCVQRLDGRTLALLFSHACHPTTVGGDNMHFTAEWPGAAVTHLRHQIQQAGADNGWTSDAIPICLVGCCGDINPIRRGTWEAVEFNGTQIGSAAHTSRWNAHGYLDESLEAQEETLLLPLQPPPSVTECDRVVEEASRRVEQARNEGVSIGRQLQVEGMLQWALDIREAALTSNPKMYEPFTIQHFSLGGVHLLGFPAEMFVDYQLDLTARSRVPIMALNCTNGCANYLPTTVEYPRGGYEVGEAYKYYGTRMFAPECDPLVRQTLYRMTGIETE